MLENPNKRVKPSQDVGRPGWHGGALVRGSGRGASCGSHPDPTGVTWAYVHIFLLLFPSNLELRGCRLLS
ncbi:unnamed protein product [Victoria cruziana]